MPRRHFPVPSGGETNFTVSSIFTVNLDGVLFVGAATASSTGACKRKDATEGVVGEAASFY